MKKNIGLSDRIIRFIIAVIVLIYAIWQWSIIALLIAIFTFYETFASWCILYQLLGKNSCPISTKKK